MGKQVEEPVLNFYKIKARKLLEKMYVNQKKGEEGFSGARKSVVSLIIEVREEIEGREIRRDNIDDIQARLKYWGKHRPLPRPRPIPRQRTS